MKKKIIISAVFLVIIFALAYRFSQKSPVAEKAQAPIVQNVSVQIVKDSITLKQSITYPATVVGDQEVSVVAASTGNTIAVPFNLGQYVSAGTLLARIDNTGNTIDTEYKNFQSSQIQQSHLTKEQAEESLKLAEKNYRNLKNAYDEEKKDPSLTKTVSKAQVDAAKVQINIAETQLESARVDLRGTLDEHLITSPISGYISEKFVSVGDAVSAGQKIASVSQTRNIKFQFFVDAEHLANFYRGLEIKAAGSDGNEVLVVVRNISPVADTATKRFLIEAYPKTKAAGFFSGTLANVLLETTSLPSVEGNLILPLSAVTIGQNESYIFINNEGKAQKLNVSIGAVKGETAEIKADLAPDAQIILNGSKLVHDGEEIKVQK